MAQVARSYKEGIRPPALDSAGGVQEGQLVIQTTPASSGDPQVIVPTGTAPWLTPPYGISEMSGFVGGSGSAAGEAQSIKRQGLGRALLTHGNTITRGQEFQADAGVLGNVVPRAPYSFSAWALGTFEEAYSSSSTDDLVEIYLQPVLKEICRRFAGYVGTAPAAGQIKYANGPSGAVAASDVPLMMADFTGQVVRDLYIGLTTAPAAGETLQAIVRRNPLVAGAYTGFADTAITCTISGTGLVAVDHTNSLALNQGDLLAIKFVASNNGGYAAAGLSYGLDLT